jgi:hypothetical protein
MAVTVDAVLRCRVADAAELSAPMLGACCAASSRCPACDFVRSFYGFPCLLRAACVLAVGCALRIWDVFVCCACACDITFPVFVGFAPGVKGGRPPLPPSRFLSLSRRGVGHARVQMLALPPLCRRSAEVLTEAIPAKPRPRAL